MSNHQLLYTRRDKEIRGPFPKKLITRYILIGRVLPSDEVSVDQRNWVLISSVADLIPQEMKADLSIPENMEKLRLARMREDERKYGDRRQQGVELEEQIRKRRSGVERRDAETVDILRHRLIKTQTHQILVSAKPSYVRPAIALVIILGLILGATFLYSPAQQIAVNNCNLAAQPNVNWNNCRFEGRILNAVNLQGAKLQNASLVAAQLRGADLSQAQMAYCSLLNADARNTNLSGATLTGAVLRKADLRATNLQNTDLSFAILQNVDLSNANLSHANLTQAVLTGATMTNTILNGAILDKAIWMDNSICAPESIGKCIPLASVPSNAEGAGR